MRVCREPRIRKPWSDLDRNTAAAMLDSGSDYRDIARALGRKPDAVKAWVHHYLKATSRKMPVVEIVLPVAAVDHADVPAFYILGWRFSGLEDGLCIFEWPCSGAPKWPQSNQVEPQRELEAA